MTSHEDEKLPPSPGSDEAIALGCTCPVLDNSHGHGYMGQADIFIMTESCPLHGFARALAASQAEEE